MSRSFGVVAILCATCATFAPSALAQESREVQVQFDSLSVTQVDGRSVSEWLRPVLFHEGSRLKSNFGIDEGNGYIQFWGAVEIVEKGDTIWTDRLRYHKESKVGVAEGNVRMSDGEVLLRSPSATHYSDNDLTIFTEGVAYADTSTALTAEGARYYSEDNRAEFSGSVRLEQERLVLHADSLSYLRDEELSRAWGNILVSRVNTEDSLQTHILAKTLYRDSSRDSIFVSGNARMALINPQEQDTVYVRAESITITDRDQMLAVDSVHVSSETYDILGDSLSTWQTEAGFQRSEVRGSPMAWVENSQIKATYLLLAEASDADSLLGEGDVFVSTLDSATERINQLKGEHLKITMVQDSIRAIQIEENAEAVLYFEQEEGGETAGLRGSGDGMNFTFDGGALERFAFYEGVETTYYAGHLLDQLSNLAGYIHAPEDRPSRDERAADFWMDYYRIIDSNPRSQSTVQSQSHTQSER